MLYNPGTFNDDMTMRNGGSSNLRFLAAAILAAVMMLSVLHGLVPHPQEQGPCIACQTLTAPALMPLAESPGLALEPRRFFPIRRGDAPIEPYAPVLRPLRAPPLSTAA